MEALSYYDEALLLSFATANLPFTNWSAHRLSIWSRRFPTVEHAYQFKKFELSDPAWAQRIRLSKSPYEAKRLAHQKVIDSESWNIVREIVMVELIKAKIEQHEDVREALLGTGSRTIAETSHVDSFWGAGKDGTGQNVLGKIWMQLRQGLQEV